MDREAWRAAVHGVPKSRTRLSDWTEQWARQEWLTGRQRGPRETPDCQGTSPVETPVPPTHHASDQGPSPSLFVLREWKAPDDATLAPCSRPPLHRDVLLGCPQGSAGPDSARGVHSILFPPSPRPGLQERWGHGWASLPRWEPHFLATEVALFLLWKHSCAPNSVLPHLLS